MGVSIGVLTTRSYTYLINWALKVEARLDYVTLDIVIVLVTAVSPKAKLCYPGIWSNIILDVSRRHQV